MRWEGKLTPISKPVAANRFESLHLAAIWFHYRQLPPEIQRIADKNFEILRGDPRHKSLRLKKVGVFWSARVGLNYRAVAKEGSKGLTWFWIGTHDEYKKVIS